jgi:hypothetical protein
MKIRHGFVSNSSSSSFVIGSNEQLDDTIEKNLSEIFPSNDERTQGFFELLAREISWEMDMWGEHETWDSWNDFCKDWLTDGYIGEMPEDVIQFFKPFFDKWKYVHELRIPSNGDGGTRLSQVFRYAFPREFENANCQIKIDDEG